MALNILVMWSSGEGPICSDLDPNDGDGKAFLNLEITLGNRLCTF